MLQFLESPGIIWLIIAFFSLFLFILFLTMSPRTNGKRQISTGTSMRARPMKVTKGNPSECTMFGFLEKLPQGDPIPDECMSCRKLVECLMKKNAFNWYTGQNSAKNSKKEG